jgi:hypothetical protein
LTAGANYHWRYRAVDSAGGAGPWTEFLTPGNIDFSVTNPAPTIAVLQQRIYDGSCNGNEATVAVGGSVTTTIICLEANVSDTDPIRLELEVQPVGAAFTNIATYCSPTCSTTAAAGTKIVTVSGLSLGASYHWQARGLDNLGTASAWIAFGGNPETNPDFSVVNQTDTGLRSPTANEADSGGDGNGYQTSPADAYGDDTLYAVDTDSGSNISTSCTNSGKDRHRFYNYDFSIPTRSTIRGIEVRLDAMADSTSGSPKICVQISWNGGSSWTAAKSTAMLGTTMQTFTLGSSADTWGRTWGMNAFSNANFRVRVIDVSGNTARDFSLDWVAVRVYY